MPTKPTEEELVAFLRTYSCFAGVDVNEFWASVQPEIFNLTARPIDIKETFPFFRSVSSGPTVTTEITQTFAPTAVDRILIIRSIFWQRQGANQPDTVRIEKSPGATIMWEDDAPAIIPIGGQNEPAGFGSRMPIVLYGTEEITFAFTIAVAISMEFQLDIVGEEFEMPFRNVGT